MSLKKTLYSEPPTFSLRPKKHRLLSALQTRWGCDLQACCNLFHRGFYYCVKALEKQNCCASQPALAPFPTFQGTYSFSLMLHLFDVAVLQSTHTLLPLLFRGFSKNNIWGRLYSQQAGETREHREIGWLYVLSDHEGMLGR